MKKIVIALLIITGILIWDVTRESGDTIIIYSSAEQFRNDEMQRQLNEEFPDQNIYVMYMPTAKSAAKIGAEGEDTDADIVMAMETAYLEKIKDNLDPVEDLSTLDYLDDMHAPDG